MKKINVVGTSGSGKSYVAKRISDKLSMPYIQLDQLFWGKNWTPYSEEVFFEKVQSSLEQDQWVLDGNYNRTIPMKWKEVDTVVWIDFSFTVTLWQAVTRAFLRAVDKRELWPGTGNRGSFKRSFLSKDSIILWTISTYRKVRIRYEEYMNDPQYSHINFIRLRSRKGVRNFLDVL